MTDTADTGYADSGEDTGDSDNNDQECEDLAQDIEDAKRAEGEAFEDYRNSDAEAWKEVNADMKAASGYDYDDQAQAQSASDAALRAYDAAKDELGIEDAGDLSEIEDMLGTLDNAEAEVASLTGELAALQAEQSAVAESIMGDGPYDASTPGALEELNGRFDELGGDIIDKQGEISSAQGAVGAAVGALQDATGSADAVDKARQLPQLDQAAEDAAGTAQDISSAIHQAETDNPSIQEAAAQARTGKHPIQNDARKAWQDAMKDVKGAQSERDCICGTDEESGDEAEGDEGSDDGEGG